MHNERLQAYIEKMIPDRSDLIMEMEAYAKEHKVPIMEIEGIEAMLQLLRIQQPQSILEVGTAIGYSALRMAYALPDIRIVTIERDAERYEEAEKFIARSGKEEHIAIIKGDALEVEDEIKDKGPYDSIFIDAAKGQYKRFFEIYSKYLNVDGLIITDNVLFKGLVYESEIENKRIRNLVRKINDFNQWLMNNEDYHTVILPIGDGVAISKRK
ncbi:O-methyltransferase [Cytobacillus purgationiresistens]|uniref:tRNA 5-hydroxyuridine methyltransferase n=1 Tax=Cytobacillus purgationiresistens TaxID=863449 RepID=A0ABU0AEU8_9BACI|nr:O-methyltransferase [Cytobacillus purgationiresistens]MDQ0269550.1 putative O-methyltransferase YrrM [Cytobacillus purgationiresistens]